MSDNWNLPWSASCLCGQVKMQVTQAPMLAIACHCKGCQKLTSSTYSPALILPANGFEIIEGTPVLGGLHGAHKQYYCDHCKSWLFTRPAGMEAIINLRATILDDASWVVPFIDIETADKLPGVITGAQFSFEGTPPTDKFIEISAQYAKEGSRPL